MARKKVRRNKYGVFLKVEKLGQYSCEVWKDAKGSSTTYRWIEVYEGFPLVRQTIVVSNRSTQVHHYAGGSGAYIRTKAGVLKFCDFVGITPIKIEHHEFRYAMAETAFGGWIIDTTSIMYDNTDRVRAARIWS